MSFRSFIYYCALCGGCAAYVGWVLGRPITAQSTVTRAAVQGLFLGLMIALSLGLLDGLWNGSAGRSGELLLRVLTAVAVGCLGGWLGGMLGQALFRHSANSFVLLIGWVLTGVLVGGALGVYDLLSCALREEDMRGAVRKTVNGVVGGGAGGLLGGISFLLLGLIWGAVFRDRKEDFWSPAAWGFVALGLCIGLLIGLAQVILKEAWLKVEVGFRSGRELILSRPEVTIGRGESCDIGLFGDALVEKLHCRIVRSGNDYVLIDGGSPSGTYVNDERVEGPRRLRSGDLISLGRARLRFGERQKRT
jgi:hypothetical protein